MERLPVPQIRYLLNQSFSPETSVAPQIWTPDNPSYGHCFVAALVAKDYSGGKIIRGAFPPEWWEKMGSKSHYWNLLPDGRRLDTTSAQFPKDFPDFPYEAFVSGKYGEQAEFDDTAARVGQPRYDLLKAKFDELLNSEPLYKDAKHQRLWELAFMEDSKCPKLRFACQVYDGDKLLTETVNGLRTTQFGRERFCALDGSACIREGIQSRTDATLGDCEHSQIWAMKNVFELGYKPSDLPKLDFYEAGFNPKDFSPWWGRKEKTYTCTYCENLFATFGLDKSTGIYQKQWTTFYTKDSFYTSAPLALGLKLA